MLQDANQAVHRHQQENYALSLRLDQLAKYSQELYEQMGLYQSTITELKHQLDIQKGLKLTQLSVSSLSKLEEEQTRILQRIQAQKKSLKVEKEGKAGVYVSVAAASSASGSSGMCSVCFRAKIDAALQPCGHQISCQVCRVDICGVCGTPVKGVLPLIDIERISTPSIPDFTLIQPPPLVTASLVNPHAIPQGSATGTSTPIEKETSQ